MLEVVGDKGGAPILVSPDELSHLLAKSQIEGASFPFILNTCFYNDQNALTVAKRKAISMNARLSLIGGVVEENFGDSFGSAATGGLYDRFLFGLKPSGHRFLYRPSEAKPVVELRDVSPELFAPTARKAKELPTPEIDRDVWQSRDQMVEKEGIEPRILEIALRTALICAAWDGLSTLRASRLEPAWELARYQQRVRAILQPNPGRNFEAQAAHRILAHLRRHACDGKWEALREVRRATRIMDFGPSVADRAINGLIGAGEIESTTLNPPNGGRGGRPSKLIRLALVDQRAA
jgi:hypothetical protein